MRQQLLRECDKLTHAWSVRIVFLLFLAGGIITAATSELTGYIAPFMGYYYWGNTGTIMFAAIVAGQVAGEYRNGRAARNITAGTKRGQYFAAKILSLFCLSSFFFLSYTVVSSLLCRMTNGAGSGYFSHYPLQAAVFLFCRVLVYWVYTTVFILIGVVTRRSLWAYILSCGVVFLEHFLWLEQTMKNGQTVMGGPLSALMQIEKYIGMADFLSYDFYLLFVPSAYMGIFALMIGYYVFRRGKLPIQPQKRSIARFAGRLSGLVAMTSVLFWFCGRTAICAGENTVHHTNLHAVENVGELRLVFGDSNLDDRDAFVLFLMAEGFTEKEQEDFFRNVESLISALMCISPYDEFADVTKIYALGTISAETGIAGEQADTWEQARQDSRDTFFGASFWEDGQNWKLGLSQEGFGKLYDLRQQLLPAADFCGIIVNSDIPRGTTYYDRPTGNIFLVTLDAGELSHELGHATARLADEYDRKGYYSFSEAPNMTREADPQEVRWARYIGMNDISVYEYTYDRNGWYHPSKICIMRSEDTGRFCQVCEDALRENICKYCTTARLLFNSCGEQICESKTGTDLREYFSVQKMFSALDSSQIPEEILLLSYYDADGRALGGLPQKAGSYSVEAEFLGCQIGNIVYDPCTLRVSYEIKPDPAKVFWLSMAPLFIGTTVWIFRRTGRRIESPGDTI